MARLLFGTPTVFLFFSTEMRGAPVCSSAHTVGIRLAKASYAYRSPVTIRHPSVAIVFFPPRRTGYLGRNFIAHMDTHKMLWSSFSNGHLSCY